MRFIESFFESLSRAWSYAKFGWSCFDYDYTFLYSHILFKLERMRTSIISSGIVDLEEIEMKKAMDALNESIEICKRIVDGDYEKEDLLEFEKKHPCMLSNIRDWLYEYGDRQNKELQDEFHAIFDRGEQRLEKDRQDVHKYIVTYGDRWWW